MDASLHFVTDPVGDTVFEKIGAHVIKHLRETEKQHERTTVAKLVPTN